MDNYFNDISTLAKKALIYEVLLTPKPGLVDRNNSGAHGDMDIYTFMDSILSFENYFYNCIKEGYLYNGDDYFEILNSIRPIGILAEDRMFKITGGINTHKGAIFIFGILNSAIGSLIREEKELSIDSISLRSSEISDKILDDFKLIHNKKTGLSYGESQFMKFGILGIRGEAKSGFPSIKSAYKIFTEIIKLGYDEKVAMGESLIELMSILSDTNIIGRKGVEGINYLKDKAEIIKSFGGYKSETGILKLYDIDEEFIRNDISPGGCADLAAATLFLYWVMESQNPCKAKY